MTRRIRRPDEVFGVADTALSSRLNDKLMTLLLYFTVEYPLLVKSAASSRKRSGCHAATAYPRARNCQQRCVAREGSKSEALDWLDGLLRRKMDGVKRRVDSVELWEPYLRSFRYNNITNPAPSTIIVILCAACIPSSI